jgi:hypothetical protein
VIDRVTALPDLLILIHSLGNFIITLSPLVRVHRLDRFNCQGVVCFVSAVSTPDAFSLTALYQKNSSKAVLPAVSQAASSEYVHQLDILLCSAQEIVNVVYFFLGVHHPTMFSIGISIFYKIKLIQNHYVY